MNAAGLVLYRLRSRVISDNNSSGNNSINLRKVIQTVSSSSFCDHINTVSGRSNGISETLPVVPHKQVVRPGSIRLAHQFAAA